MASTVAVEDQVESVPCPPEASARVKQIEEGYFFQPFPALNF